MCLKEKQNREREYVCASVYVFVRERVEVCVCA